MATQQHRCPADPEVGNRLLQTFLVDSDTFWWKAQHFDEENTNDVSMYLGNREGGQE